MQRVTVGAERLDALAEPLGVERFGELEHIAGTAADALSGRAVVNVNSTAVGGGVAEMLVSLLAYARGVDIDVRWLTVEGPPAFFAITKRVHNLLYGSAGDGMPLEAAESAVYDDVLAREADDLLTVIRPGDLVLLHDPQTLGLVPSLRRHVDVRIVWRCHVGADRANEHTEAGWKFLARYLDEVDDVVVSRSAFAPPGYPSDRVHVIPPSIDPLAVKNVELAPDLVHDLLVHAGLLQGDVDTPPVFPRRDGSPARLDRRADVIQLGPPPPPDAPVVVQVSRWDRLKDMRGVMEGYAEHVDGGAHLILAGPNVMGVADDPEGAAVLEECIARWRDLPHGKRQHVHLACLPTADVDENAVLVNALQRHAAVVTQKSLAEGFGLTVAEAMWKARPVVASAVGGIVDQIPDAGCGVLLDDPHDLAAFGAAVRDLVHDPALAAKVGAAARERARAFLPDLHLRRWATLLTGLTPPSS